MNEFGKTLKYKNFESTDIGSGAAVLGKADILLIYTANLNK